jgi:hypothetical protein
MEEGRKRVVAIIAGILVARHLKNPEDLDSRPSPRTDSLVASAIQWAERIMRKIDNVFWKVSHVQIDCPPGGKPLEWKLMKRGRR